MERCTSIPDCRALSLHVCYSQNSACHIPVGEGEALSSTPIHRGPISSLESLPEAHGPLVLSGGKLDHVIRLLQARLILML